MHGELGMKEISLLNALDKAVPGKHELFQEILASVGLSPEQAIPEIMNFTDDQETVRWTAKRILDIVDDVWSGLKAIDNSKTMLMASILFQKAIVEIAVFKSGDDEKEKTLAEATKKHYIKDKENPIKDGYKPGPDEPNLFDKMENQEMPDNA